MTFNKKNPWLATMILSLALAAFACDDDDDTQTDAGSLDAGETDGNVTADGGTTDAGDEQQTILEIAAGNPDFSLLAAAATRADLTGALSTVELTVFAPTNDAFAASGITEEMINEMPVEDLTAILLYHAVAGTVLSSDVPTSASSLSNNAYGDPMTLLFDTSDGVTINGTAQVTAADVLASNGVIHVIDHVLLPMNAVEAATAAGLTGLTGAVAGAANIGETSVADALAAEVPYTIFAPTNEAFTAVSEALGGFSAEQVRDTLLYHVLDTSTFTTPVLAADLPVEVTELATLNGQTATLDPTVSPPTIESANIVATDIVVTNGVIHLIDAVLVPAF